MVPKWDSGSVLGFRRVVAPETLDEVIQNMDGGLKYAVVEIELSRSIANVEYLL